MAINKKRLYKELFNKTSYNRQVVDNISWQDCKVHSLPLVYRPVLATPVKFFNHC